MASTQPSSRFSTLKVFRFTSPKPPPPPPKDPIYLHPSSSNLSVASFSNQSRPTTSPKVPSRSPTNSNCTPSIRTPSPTPSSATQHTLQRRQVGQSPSASMSTTTLSPDSSSTSGNSKRGFFRKVSALRKRSASKNTRTSGADEPTDDESISRPWNFQHNIHIDEAFQGIPPSWSSTLAELGYSEAEIALILKGRRNRILESSPAQDRAPSTTPSRSQSPTSINPPVRSSSLRRQRSDGSISRSERSLRIGPPAPPPPLPLPPPPQPPQTPQTPNHGLGAPAAPPPTPASGGNAFGNANDADGVGTPSEAQYVYIHHQRQTPNGLMAVPSLASVPVVQLPPVRQPPHSRTNSSTSTPTSTPTLPSRSASVRSERERRPKNPPPPRSAFRIVNTTSPPPRYSDDVVRSGSPPPLTLGDALRPRPQEKEGSSYSPKRSPAFVPQDQIKTPPSYSPQASGVPHSPATEDVEAAGRGTEAERGETQVHDHGSDRTSSERRLPVLSILPPRVSLRKDTLEDLSSWSASLFSSLPSALHDSPSSSASTTATSVSSASTRSSKFEIRRHGSKPSVTLPTIVLQPEVPEEDEEVVGEEEELIEHDYSHTASPLYHELMGMMQGRAAAANSVGSAGSGSPASATFQLDTAFSSSHATSSRDSQLTIRLDPRRDSSRDSSASTSTFTHATIVRGASIVRRVRADVVTTPPIVTLKGKEREQERGPIQIVQEDDDDSSSDATYSDDDDASGSPGGTLSLTSGPDSQEAAGWSKSPRQALRHGSPLPSPSPSPLRTTFLEPGMEEKAQWGQERQKASTPGPYATPPPSAPPVQIHWLPTATSAPDLVTPDGVLPISIEPAENAPMPPRFTSTGPAKPRYPSWLAAIVLPLAEFIDDSADPRVLFTDLSEIAQGESGSVYSAHAAPAVVPQFRPPMPRSPVEQTEDESGVPPKEKQKLEMVAIKRVPISRGGTEKLADLRRELELARALRHANVLRMERLYVDVVEESLWISMELMDRSLADVLAVVGKGVESVVALEAEEGGSGDVELVELSEGMVARFVSDVLLALSYIRKHHIAHRDIRSDNLLVSRSGVLKLSDFSTAVCSPPGSPKCTDPVGVLYWQAPEMRTGLYDPLEVDVWSLGATTWELVHGDPPFVDVQDPRHIVSEQLPPVRQPEAFSRSFHDFLHLCSQPAALRPDADELLNTQFVQTACPRSEIVRLLGQCKAIDEQQLHRQSGDSDI